MAIELSFDRVEILHNDFFFALSHLGPLSSLIKCRLFLPFRKSVWVVMVLRILHGFP